MTTENPSAASHQHRLHQELAEQTRGRRAEGKTNARFFRAIQAAHQRQQGDAGARDQQDKANGGEQHLQHRGGFADGFGAERRQLHAPSAIGIRELASEIGCHAVELLLGLLDGHTGRETCDRPRKC